MKTKEEIAKEFGVTVKTVQEWRRVEGCPAKKVRSAWRFDLKKVKA